MFEISYRGGNSVVITTKKDELYIDPDQSSHGLKAPKLKNAVQIATEPRFLLEQSPDADRPALQGPGEYEVGPFAITGFEVAHHLEDGAMKAAGYRIVIGDIAIGVLGNIAGTLSEDELETLGVVDVLILPVGGGGYTLDAKEAGALVRKVEPKAIVPVHYNESGVQYEVAQDALSEFVTELGAPLEQQAKLKVKSPNDLPPTLTIIQLERV